MVRTASGLTIDVDVAQASMVTAICFGQFVLMCPTIAGCGVESASKVRNVKLETRDLNVYECCRSLGASRVQGYASSPVPKGMLMSSASIFVACATQCVMKGLMHGHACGSNVALIH